MYYVYILRGDDGMCYTGVSENLKRRLREHFPGGAKYSGSKVGLKLKWYCVFADKAQAYAFERYLKSGSGTAFRNKHLF